MHGALITAGYISNIIIVFQWHGDITTVFNNRRSIYSKCYQLGIVVISALGRHRQNDGEFSASLG